MAYQSIQLEKKKLSLFLLQNTFSSSESFIFEEIDLNLKKLINFGFKIQRFIRDEIRKQIFSIVTCLHFRFFLYNRK